MKIAILHPGEMGVSLASALLGNKHQVCWVSEGRSQASVERAKAAGLEDLATLSELARVDAVISVCPPHAAHDLAAAVMQTSFDGIYLDANALAPNTAAGIAKMLGKRYVDGGIIGPPATKTGSTRLYLSGNNAQAVQNWFDGSPLQALLIEGDDCAASALKMCYAAYTKGSAALLLAVRALAEANGVSAALLAEWALSQPKLERRSEQIARGTGPKAWRFAGEMAEIAATFRASGLPAGFHQAAQEVFQNMVNLKDSKHPSLEQALASLLDAAE